MVSVHTLHHQRPPRNFKDKNTPGCYSESWMQRTEKPLFHAIDVIHKNADVSRQTSHDIVENGHQTNHSP